VFLHPRGFGYLEDAYGARFYFDRSDFGADLATAQIGTRVQFHPTAGTRGPRARRVRVLSGPMECP
jgi:cold shock CspA family protein